MLVATRAATRTIDPRPAPRDIEARGHVAGHAAVEFVTGDATQLREDGRAVLANMDIGESRIERDGLVGIQDQRPGDGPMLDGIE
jgi:hypothetical protein